MIVEDTMRTFLNRITARSATPALPSSRVEAGPCAECALVTCRAGVRSVVVALRCDAPEACRLRTLGLIEGAPVTVLDCRHGLLLEVRGARVAISSAIARLVNVRPLAA
jgi:Fe2+ transport system protein FeoA